MWNGSQFTNFWNKKVIEVKDSKDKEMQAVQMWNNNGGTNQKWNIIYLDEAKKVATEGFNEEFGFHINRKFYIRSRLPMQRVMEMHGNRYVYLRRWINGRTGQLWRFDEKSKTVLNMWHTNYALEIQSNGNGRHIYTTPHNSRWW
jgi:hypothetical protein